MEKREKDKRKKKKRNTALVICRDKTQFWTTQSQFWQWFREGVLLKTKDNPLTGQFVREDEERLVMVQHTLLNLACPHHLSEALSTRRYGATNR
jgi:hypothetical protein